MNRQSAFLVYANVKAGQEDALRACLQRLNRKPGLADPDNEILPFRSFEELHVARFVVVDDPTLGDQAVYSGSQFDPPVSLAFMGFSDCGRDQMLSEFARRAPGLRKVFGYCEGFDDDTDLISWLRDHSRSSATDYVNCQGRSMNQVREEDGLQKALRRGLTAAIKQDADAPADPSALAIRLREEVNQPLTGIPSPSFLDRLRKWASFASVPLALLLLSPVILVLAIPFALILRHKEKRDPVIAPRPSAERIEMLSRYESHDVTNPFSAVGSLKTGLFRSATARVAFWLLRWSAENLYTKGRLARVGTIHFARWFYIDDGKRLVFTSNYDGSLEAYMDDFINKVSFGLNLVFSNGIGYPHTDWLIIGGARKEQDFKSFLRHHQLPTDVWYKAAHGLSTYDMARNTRIREGYENGFKSNREAARWLAEIAA